MSSGSSDCDWRSHHHIAFKPAPLHHNNCKLHRTKSPYPDMETKRSHFPSLPAFLHHHRHQEEAKCKGAATAASGKTGLGASWRFVGLHTGHAAVHHSNHSHNEAFHRVARGLRRTWEHLGHAKPGLLMGPKAMGATAAADDGYGPPTLPPLAFGNDWLDGWESFSAQPVLDVPKGATHDGEVVMVGTVRKGKAEFRCMRVVVGREATIEGAF